MADGQFHNDADATLVLVHDAGKTGHFPAAKPQLIVTFDRRELALILAVYGRMVGSGDWRDYAMDFLRERAIFSIYARVSERPLFIVEKTPKLRTKQGQFSVTNQQGRILKRGNDLGLVLRVLDPQLVLVR